MTPPQFIRLGFSPSTFDHITNGAPLEGAAPGLVSLLRDGARGLAWKRTFRSEAELTDALLSRRLFECMLERERSLADRGTRRFSLLVLSLRSGQRGPRERDALAQLARQTCKRLRSTDLVGLVAPERVEILLTDTEPSEARIVAAWVEQLEGILGLDLEHAIHVYPTAGEPRASAQRHNGSHSSGPHDLDGSNGSATNGSHGDRVLRRRGPTPSPFPGNRVAANGSSVHDFSEELRRPRSPEVLRNRWPLKDLWPILRVPTPFWKRFTDVVLSGIALLVLLPLFALIAIAIKLDSPGPVIFEQRRAGRGGRPFAFYKFRSMVADAESRRASLASQNEQDGPVFKIRKDPRITRVGRFLRRWSIDELPQLWNVFKGDISLVGPRSPTFDEVCQYERWQRRRLGVIGGITCTWQVSGRSQIPFREWMRLDLRYIAARSLWHDLRLLMRTLPAVLSGRGAC